MPGMTPAETAIMDLWDTGHAITAIARRTGRPVAVVRKVVSIYHEGTEAGDETRKTIAASTLLATAIRAERANGAA